MCFPREEAKFITLLLHLKNMKPITIDAIVSHGTFRNLPPTTCHKRENLDAYYD